MGPWFHPWWESYRTCGWNLGNQLQRIVFFGSDMEAMYGKENSEESFPLVQSISLCQEQHHIPVTHEFPTIQPPTISYRGLLRLDIILCTGPWK